MNVLDSIFKGIIIGAIYALMMGAVSIRIESRAPTKEDAAVMKQCLAEKRPVQECLLTVEAERILRAGK